MDKGIFTDETAVYQSEKIKVVFDPVQIVMQTGYGRQKSEHRTEEKCRQHDDTGKINLLKQQNDKN